MHRTHILPFPRTQEAETPAARYRLHRGAASVTPPAAAASPWLTVCLPMFRFAVYTAALVGLLLVLPRLAETGGVAAFMEGGHVEWIQFALIAIVATMLAVAAFLLPTSRGVLTGLATLALIAMIREQDMALNELLGDFGWAGVAGIAFLVGAVLVWAHRAAVLTQLAQLLSSRACGILWVGFILVCGFAQLVGHGALFENLLKDGYYRESKRVVQEIAETIGYGVLLIGAVETVLLTRQLARFSQGAVENNQHLQSNSTSRRAA